MFFLFYEYSKIKYLFNILIFCGIALGLNSLDICYTITLIGDGQFNVMINNDSEPYNSLIF